MNTNLPQLAVVVLAAGKGTRMKSDLPKVLHPLAGKPMIGWVVDLAEDLGAMRTVVVVGHGAEQVKAHLAGRRDLLFALQEPQLGTGHAVMAAAPGLMNFGGEVIVLYGDVPGLRRSTAQRLIDQHRSQGNDMTALAIDRDPPPAYGRLILDGDDRLTRIVEERDATPEEKKITLVSSGIFVFSCPPLLECLPLLTTDNDQNEYYLTDLAEIFHGRGLRVGYHVAPDPGELQGINSQDELAWMEGRWASTGGKED
ncbi:MAG: NTP transferase domain-containing protein [Desulfarculaceae bacterium]|nr:NTP transferase domain-containing protein [Desulfarculaceae bacterium]MCF8073651.1 NTP transferase domain-containing protein [Desulfarculaceae bacterium]MCF8103117.1 NTP transferase domain-containing protein [Desulfarculaceae bacterium]MCF8115633.1 NTP transferase domain-containing protein [Desulfarculaceae bacterium]